MRIAGSQRLPEKRHEIPRHSGSRWLPAVGIHVIWNSAAGELARRERREICGMVPMFRQDVTHFRTLYRAVGRAINNAISSACS